MEASEITELMRKYRAFRYAVSQYERTHAYPSAGIANYDAMPSGSGAPELFFDRVGKMADMGNTSLADAMDYEAYKSAVEAIDGAMQLLTEEEYSIMRLKWMDDVDLCRIAERKHMSERTVRRMHKRAVNNMSHALRFYKMPDITTDFVDRRTTGKYKQMEHPLL